MTLAPFTLKDAPAFIENQFPVGRLSAEAYKERKAGSGQTLTALGSYWKGRKPLILCRAVTLGLLLPATADPVTDLEIFLALMAMDDPAFARRWTGSAAEFARLMPDFAAQLCDLFDLEGLPLRRPRWREDLTEHERERRLAEALATLPYSIDGRLKVVKRPEELNDAALLKGIWPRVNAHLGTSASSLPQLVEQLGIARFGHRPKLADTFCGGGSIPFEAARIGCDVYASDLNPVACMLTWGAFNIIGAPPQQRARIAATQAEVAARVDAEITALGIEHDAAGNRAKAYLYCLETRCPKTGWKVPMAPSWVISKKDRVIAKLIPDHAKKRYDIVVAAGVSADELSEAESGTVQGGRLVHPINSDPSGVEIKTIRGDRPGGGNELRIWSIDDFMPRPVDILQERLYAIQWIDRFTIHESRPLTYFAAVSLEDLEREAKVERHVRQNITDWQMRGLIPDMPIEVGDKTEEPIRTRGWSYWHHLFGARQLILLSIWKSVDSSPTSSVALARNADRLAKLCRWNAAPQPGQGPKIEQVFSNQALNTLVNYASYSFAGLENFYKKVGSSPTANCAYEVKSGAASTISMDIDLLVTDPPYADAVSYHEITEFFIAWLRKNPPSPFDEWTWDSRRTQAIKGKDVGFRRQMVEAYSAMTKRMPDNGMQVVMFTHQDAGVWADLAGICGRQDCASPLPGTLSPRPKVR